MPTPSRAQRHETKNTPQTVALEKIRPELNLEKWFIWQPAKSKSQPQARVIARALTSNSGDKITGKLKVGYTDLGPLTTEDQKTYYALVKHWEQRGRPDQYTAFSLREISRLLKKRWGTNVIDSLTDSLMRLRGTLLVWENSYFNNTTKETAELIDTFNILADLKIVRRKIDGVVNQEVGYFRFNDLTLGNLQTNHTKPVLFDVVLNFKSEIAQLLYTHVDLILAGNLFYERRTKELFDDLGIIGTAYQRRPSKRKQVLGPAVLELQGVPLSRGGIIASATIEKTKDQRDFKVVFRKGPAIGLPPAEVDGREPSDAASTIATERPDTDVQAEQLIAYFHHVFFGVDSGNIRPRHRDLAANLVARYGWNLAKYVVDFSYAEAQKTHFKIATFGGITQYITRALARHEQVVKEREKRQHVAMHEAARLSRDEVEQQARRRAEARYRELSDTAREELKQRYREKLISRDPTWGQQDQYGNYPLLDSAVRAAILKDFISQERGTTGEVPSI